MRHFASTWLAFLLVAAAPTLLWAQEEQPVGDQEAAAEEAEAAAPPPAPAADKWNDAHSIPRLKAPAITWPKLLTLFLVYLIWVRSVDWVNRDSQLNDLGYGKWNAIIFFPVFAGLVVFAYPILLPLPANFVVGASVISIAYLATFIPYVVTRNKRVELHERVFTPSWVRYEFATLANKVGIKVSAERKAEYEKGAAVDLMASGSDDERQNQANLITARHSPGYLLVKDLIVDMVNRRSDRVMLDYTQQSVVERHFVDGVWHNGEARDRESGDVMLAVMKTLSNLDMAERRKKQTGQFAAKYDGNSFLCPVVSQGVKTGERVVVDLLGGRRADFHTYADIGMREKLAEQWAEQMARDQGLLVISGVPEGGVTTTTDVALMETDRLLRDFVSVEEEHHREREIENIEVTTYNAAAGETPLTIMEGLIRKYPNVYVIRDFVEPEAAKLLFNEIRDDRLVITNVHAKEATEAPLRLLQQKVPHKDLAALLTAILNVRLLRKLCTECRVSYEPSPDLLKKLGIPSGKVEALYRAPKAEEIDKPCQKCGGIGFIGRTALFEMLTINDKIREILVKQPKLELLRKAARATGMRTLQEEGVLLVARGVTSLQELQRVLKQ